MSHTTACSVCRLMSQESVGAVPLCIQCLVLLSLIQYRNVTYVLCTLVPWRVTVSLNTLSEVGFPTLSTCVAAEQDGD